MRANSLARCSVISFARIIAVSAIPNASRPVFAAIYADSSHPSSFE